MPVLGRIDARKYEASLPGLGVAVCEKIANPGANPHPEPEKQVPKTFSQMKKRLEEAMTEARDAEEIIPLLKEAIAKFELVPADLFEMTEGKTKVTHQKASQSGKGSGKGAPKYRDAEGNTWAGRGRRPAWFNEALAQGKTLEDFRARGRHLRSAK